MGNIAVTSQHVVGWFPGASGDDGTLPCSFVSAGKFRHGAARLWCQAHHTHWGTKADLASFARLGERQCANHAQQVSYVVDPLVLDLDAPGHVAVWCSFPPALSNEQVGLHYPSIHARVRPEAEGRPTIDGDFPAIAVTFSGRHGLLGSSGLTRVNITPPAAREFVEALEHDVELTCINCSSCSFPHLDLGDFARTPHRKHFCGNCGRDSLWSKRGLISTPLAPLHEHFANTLAFETPNRSLNLDDYPRARYEIWPSTPAIIWPASTPQRVGLRVRLHDGAAPVLDETFGEVILDGRALDRSAVIQGSGSLPFGSTRSHQS